MGRGHGKKKTVSSIAGSMRPVPDSAPTSGRSSYLISVLAIVTLGLAVYANAVSVPFLFDDISYIVDSPAIRKLSNFMSASGEIGSIIYIRTRFISHLSFALNYAIHGLNAAGYHLFNIAVHIINALLVYWLVMLSMNTPALRQSSGRSRQYGNMIALGGALLFVCHPLETQAVTYISQRFASLSTLFYLLSVVFYIKARTGGTQGSEQSARLPLFKMLFLYLLSFMSVVLAMKTKEISFTVPIVIALCEFMFFDGPVRRRLLILLPFLCTLIIIPLAMLDAEKSAGITISNVSEAARSESGMPRADYLLTQTRVVVTYMRLLFFPVNQNLDYDYPVFHSLLTPQVIISFVLLALVLGLGVFLHYRYRNEVPQTRLVSLGIFWFFITLSVESSIIPIKDVIFEHRVYLPSIGFFIAVAAALVTVKIRLDDEKPLLGMGLTAALTAMILLFSVMTHMRNRVWQDEAGFWKDGIKKSPGKARMHNNLGVAYKAGGQLDLAIAEYKTAFRLMPDFAEPHNNLGIVYEDKGLIDEAIAEYQTAFRLKPEYAEPHHNLGGAYESRGLLDMAMTEYQTALRLKPDYTEAHNNLGGVYEAMGQPDKAIGEYQAALRLKPDYKEAHNNLGMVLASKGLSDKAMAEYKTALRLKPDFAEAHNNLGNAYASEGLSDLAIAEFQEALSLKPDFLEAHNNLGSVYAAKGLWDKAITEFRTVIRLKPDFAGAHYNLGAAFLKTGDIDSARREIELALKIKPDLDQARRLLNDIRSRKH